MNLLSDHEQYRVVLGDSITEMARMPAHSVAFSAYSPPFPSVYSYTDKQEDIGNSEEKAEFKLHFSFFFHQLVRVMQPGRVMMLHCTQILRMKRSGGQGTFDFRGLLIRLAERAGFIYDYDWVVRRNPQAQAIRTRSHSLQFKGLEKDRAQSRGAMPDFLLKFWAPGENKVPIDSPGQVSRNQWIDWAECAWLDINETDTLNVTEGRSESDTKHICALQLDILDRLVRLYSNPDEVVFDPFTGIGSTGYIALKRDRRFYGCELKPEYQRTAIRNLERVLRQRKEVSRTLFDGLDDDGPDGGSPDPTTEPTEVLAL